MADQEVPVFTSAVGSEKLTVNGAVGFTATKYKNVLTGSIQTGSARAALVTLEGTAGTNDIRWTVDGTTPASGTGHLLVAGKSTIIRGIGNITNFLAIKEGSSNGTIYVTYFI